jgi:ribosomal protein L32
MGKPKKRTSPRRTGTRRSHLMLKLARTVNAKSPVKVRTTKRESAKTATKAVKTTTKTAAKKAAQA